MLILEETKQQTDEYHADLDNLLTRVIDGDTSTEVGLNRRLAEIAEAHYKLYSEACIHLQLRFVLHQKNVALLERKAKKKALKKIATISPRVRPYLGLNSASQK